MNDDSNLYAYTFKEVDSGYKHEALWIKAYALVDGVEDKIKPKYIQLRVQAIKSCIVLENKNFSALSDFEIATLLSKNNILNKEETNWVYRLYLWADHHNIPEAVYDNEGIYISGLERDADALSSTENLYITKVSINELPSEIGHLVNLEKLTVTYTPLSKLPKELFNLVNLKMLVIHNCLLTEIPKDIEKLVNLNTIYLLNNCLRSLPYEILDLKQLTRLHIQGNINILLPREFMHMPESCNFVKDEYLEYEGSTRKNAYTLYEGSTREELIKRLRAWAYHKRLDDDYSSSELLQGNRDKSDLDSIIFVEASAYDVPKEIGLVTNLEDLHLQGVCYLPKEIINLKKLTGLLIDGSDRSGLYSLTEVFSIKSLTSLHIKDIKLETLSQNIGNLTNLIELDLSSNKLKKLPLELFNLTNLKRLTIYSNELTEIPKEIGKLKNLEELSLIYNQIKSLPIEITTLPNLQRIDVRWNDGINIPNEIKSLDSLLF